VFQLRFANFGKKPISTFKGQVLGYAHRPCALLSMKEKIDVVKSKDRDIPAEFSHLSEHQTEELLGVLDKHSSMWDESPLGELKGTFHRIDTRRSNPIHLQPHRAGPAARQREKEEVENIAEDRCH
jgi:hypothetical protein